MPTKRYWSKSFEYRALLRILDDYWLTQKDESQVTIILSFDHKNGNHQEKRLVWTNPDNKY